MTIAEEIAGIIRSLRKAKSEAELQKLVDELERRIQTLQAQLAEFEPRGLRCEACGHLKLFLTERRREDGVFGAHGAFERVYTCRQCGVVDVRPEQLS
jgi:hypothetical protein